MDVGRANFDKVLNSSFKTRLNECDFISIDLEMSGLFERSYNINAMDSLEERYQKLKSSATKFLPLQVGVCLFKKLEDNSKYKLKKEIFNHFITLISFQAAPFNFYTFPDLFNGIGRDVFTAQASSIRFLSGNSFDFNKCVAEGIPHLSVRDEERLRKRHEQRLRAMISPRSEVVLKPADEEFIRGIIDQIRMWEEGRDLDSSSLDLAPCNAYLRRIIYQEVGKRFPGYQLESGGDGSSRFIRVCVRDESSSEEIRLIKANKKIEEEVRAAVGFRRVLEFIRESGKLVVGHNCTLDLLHLCSFMNPLPDTVDEWKRDVRELFPGGVVDTKHVLSTPPLARHVMNTQLSEAYTTVLHAPFHAPHVSIAPGYDKYSNADEGESIMEGEETGVLHEAAYDAYITGVVFLKCSHLHTPHTHNKREEEGSIRERGRGPPSHHIFADKHLQRLYVMKSDIEYLDVGGTQAPPDRSHVFMVHSFNTKTNTSHIHQWFKPFGAVYVHWIDATSAFVTIRDNARKEEIIPYFQRGEARPFHIVDYHTAKFITRERATERANKRRSHEQTSTDPRNTTRKKRGHEHVSVDISDTTSKKRTREFPEFCLLS